MREIKFRGKRIDNDEWVYGGVEQNSIAIIYDDTLPYDNENLVYKETVGQFTGLYDKNGTEIYEGDIVDDSETELIYFIEFICGEFVGINEECGIGRIMNSLSEDGKVIGNIHDNPELLEKENKWKNKL